MQWSPKLKGFEKTCPVYQDVFIGRKNRVFCSDPCKARHNNDLAAERRIEEKRHTSAMLNNINIFERLFREDEFGLILNMSVQELIELGFDSKAPTNRITIDGEPWMAVGDFIYKLDDKGDVEVLRKDFRS